MSDLDLERLGEMWRADPEPAEMDALRRSAQTVARRARWGQAVDYAIALLVAGVVVYLALSNPEADTLLVGGAAILVLLGGQIRQRRLREVELRSLTGTAEEMLDQSIERLRTSRRHNRWSLVCLGPAMFVGYGLASTTGRERLAADPTVGAIWLGAIIAVMAALVIYLLSSLRNQKRELERLTALRQSYANETDQPTA